jgi:hypothetical protein
VTWLELAIDEQHVLGSQNENRLTYCSSFIPDHYDRFCSRLYSESCWNTGNAKGGDICPNPQELA